MKLGNLLEGVSVHSCGADPNLEISGISYDSKTVRPGQIFTAIAGEAADGISYADEAAHNGAACMACDRPVKTNIPVVLVENARHALAEISANYFQHPAREMTMAGITGTNGKTTSSYLVKHILETCGSGRVGLIGTICNMVGSERLSTERTTPESYEVQKLLRRMVSGGCRCAVMEVSSHALVLSRVRGIRFSTGAFTNLTQDHLDFHRTMERYCDAKAKLFRQCDTAVYNFDDPWHERILHGADCRKISFGIGNEAQIRARDIESCADHVTFTLCTKQEILPVYLPIPGLFSVYNALTALTLCQVLGVPFSDGTRALRSAKGAKGRMEVVPTPGKPYTVLIDYAHTPDALENVLKTVRSFARGRTVAVFGCGGDRDRTKRPKMGAIAGRLADFSVVTTDNPRRERPEDIIADIVRGFQPGSDFRAVTDRAEAIFYALSTAKAGDVIVLCGKGHEDYVEINQEKFPQDERKIVAQYLKNE